MLIKSENHLKSFMIFQFSFVSLVISLLICLVEKLGSWWRNNKLTL